MQMKKLCLVGFYPFQLGIEVRKNQLLKHNSQNEEIKKEIECSCSFLTDDDKMGQRFKFFSIFPSTMRPIHQNFPPVGFNLRQK